MIQTIEGRLGGGKTMLAMEWICNHIAKGGVVATNINLQVDPFSDQYGEKKGLRHVLKVRHGWELQDGQVIYLSDTNLVGYATQKGVIQLNEIVMFYKLIPRGTPEQPVLVIIDEAHIHFPQDGYKAIPKEVLHFLTLSRHACVDVVFISQHIKNMWCQMNRLTQFKWMVRDLQKYGVQLEWFAVPWLLPHFLQLKFDDRGTELIKRRLALKEKILHHGYKSPELARSFESMNVAASVQIKKRGLTMKEKAAVFAMGLAAGLAICIIPACMSPKTDKQLPEASTDAALHGIGQSVEVSSDSLAEIEPEFYIGHRVSGDWCEFITTKRHYRTGQLFQGLPVVGCKSNELLTFDKSAGGIVATYFESKPKEIKPAKNPHEST